MKANKIFAILIIILGLTGSVYMLYLTFSTIANPVAKQVVEGDKDPLGGNTKILPFGTNLEISKLKEYNATEKLFPYPKVNRTEVGTNLNSLIN